MNDKEFGSIDLLRLKYKRGDQIIQPFCKIGSLQKLDPPLCNLCKFENPERSNPESYKMHWNLMNDKEIGSEKLLNLKYRRGGPNNSNILENWFSPEIRSPLLNL